MSDRIAVGRLLRSADFERVLVAPQRSRSAHFAAHFVSGSPLPVRPTSQIQVVPALSPELSTGSVPSATPAVEDSGRWLGMVVPKRHAKRAVTRNLIKRQMRSVMADHAGELPCGLWVLRLRAPFDRAEFKSPASDYLRNTARAELTVLLHRAANTPLDDRGRAPRSSNSTKAAKSVNDVKPGRAAQAAKAPDVIEPQAPSTP